MKILVADDNQFYRLMLESTLRGWGHEVVAVDNGAKALKVLKATDAPKIAILDWLMPEVDGLEVCRTLRELQRPEPTYLILLTVKEGRENHVAALREGADDFLTKPFDHAELHARLQVALRTVGLQSSLALRVRELEDALSGAAKLEAIGRLAGGVAHDFNNILTVILGCSDILLSQRPPEQYVGCIEEIRSAADRATHLTRQLLTFSRKQVVHLAPLNLNESLCNFEKMLRRLIREDTDLKLRLAPDLKPIQADSSQIEQVIMNLVVNARDAIPEGGRIIIETENLGADRCSQEGLTLSDGVSGYVRLGVSDTGAGMDEKTQARIFEPFFTTKSPGQGTGLGLATVFGIVKQSNGTIRVWSEPGRGTLFNLFFPACLPKAKSVDVKLPTVQSSSSGGSETILLVEDEAPVRFLAQHALQQNGYQVLPAEDGQSAAVIADNYPGKIDLVLTDMVMPNLNGWQLAEHVGRCRPSSKVLFMSGYSEQSQRFRSISHFDQIFLAKPFTLPTLIEKVRRVLDSDLVT